MMALLMLVLGLAVAALLYQGSALRRYRREGARLAITGRDLSDRVRLLEQELAALCGASAGAVSQLNGLERRVRRIRERQDHLESRAGLRRARTQVDRPVASDAPNDEAGDSGGLTRAETELLLMKPRGNA